SRNAGSIGNPSPDRKTFLKVETDAVYSLEDFAKGHVRLGGLEIDTAAFRARALTTRSGHGITLVDAVTGKARVAETPAGADVSAATWSPDGKTIAYVADFPKASHIMLLDVASGKSTQLTKTQLNAVHFLTAGGGQGPGQAAAKLDWTRDGKSIIAVLVPQ